jgi:hypothetical protein
MDANGHLMAAAPDLLAACKEAQEIMISIRTAISEQVAADELVSMSRHLRLYQMIAAAIARAEGREG